MNVDHRSKGTITVPLPTSIPFVTAFQLLDIRWSFLNDGRFNSCINCWSVNRICHVDCCYNANMCRRGQKCNYTVINQSDSFHRNSTDFKFVCMQVYQTLLLLRVRGSGSETVADKTTLFGCVLLHTIGFKQCNHTILSLYLDGMLHHHIFSVTLIKHLASACCLHNMAYLHAKLESLVARYAFYIARHVSCMLPCSLAAHCSSTCMKVSRTQPMQSPTRTYFS